MFSRFRHIYLILLLLPTTSFTVGDGAVTSYMAKWVVLSGCSLQVNGSTNINNFCCRIAEYSKPDTIIVYKGNEKELSLPVTGMLNLEVAAFDCQNSMMTKDLRKTLKAGEFPFMHIRFISFNKLPDLRLQQDPVTGLVDIDLAGVIRRFTMNYMFSADGQKVIHLEGKRAINFSDFNLEPPRKLGGMIRAYDKLDVVFQLNLKMVP